MLPTPTLFLVAIVLLVMMSLIVLITGGIVPMIVLLFLVGIVGVVLFKMGFLDITSSPTGLDIKFVEKSPAPAAPKAVLTQPKSLEQKEVFNVGGNEFTYDEAAAVCAAYDADLATYEQVNDAYTAGAEWCGYGWTQGGMALYPTQQSTWETLQQEVDETKRTACGRPGVNGGYFDPANKFGVNCYGVKPGGKGMKFPLPLPGTDAGSFDRMVDRFKGMLSKFSVASFNRDGWSEWNVASHAPAAVTSALKKV